MADTKDEFSRTYKATLLFIKDAPLVQIKNTITNPNQFMLRSLERIFDRSLIHAIVGTNR